MKKRVYLLLVQIASLAFLCSLIAITVIFSKGFEKQVFRDLEIVAHLYADLDEEIIRDMGTDLFLTKNIRISLIAEDGTVLYDNDAEMGNMDNHSGREEVIMAQSSGSGYTVRRSDTLEKSLFYYALATEEGNVVRVAREVDNILSIFKQYIPILFILAVMLYAFCMIIARFFTQKLIAPIENLAENLDGQEKIETYGELMPFINMIYKQHEDILKSAQMRQDFTANVSHELKTPLTAISGYSELIENGMATEENTRHFAGEIHKNAARLLSLINDIIRLSELDAEEVSGAFEKIPLNQVAENCVNMLQMNAKKHHVKITYTGEPCEVLSTKEMMEELVYNLCDNAIRYNVENGRVDVRVRHLSENVLLEIVDTGIGISPEHQDRIFERFYRVDKSRSKSTGGTGLGLAIVKHIVAQSAAEMELESAPGKGTKISIVFPKISAYNKDRSLENG